jgi:23S rRNA (uracil1939-C5)-methyltransferase
MASPSTRLPSTVAEAGTMCDLRTCAPRGCEYDQGQPSTIRELCARETSAAADFEPAVALLELTLTVTVELDIVRLGAQGDGIADTGAGPRYVPFALPGERVRFLGDAIPEVVSGASSDRAAPLCRHFGTCGGCVAQHMSDRLYADWKRSIVNDALRQHGLQADVAPLRRIPPGSRRRAVLTAWRKKDGSVGVGYHRRQSNDLVEIEECPILVPAMVARLPFLRAVAAIMPGRDTRITVLLTRGGLDISINHNARHLGPEAVAGLGRVAAEHSVARVTVNGETMLERAAPALSLGGVDAVPPPGAFVQAAEAAELAITQLVVDAIGGSKRVADLFCGIGTLTFPIARLSRVLAVDGDQAAIAALDAAARHAQRLKPIETRVRDLFREPLSPRELKDFDTVIFDPPRAGARAQAERLAKSDVPVVVAVSCDPGTLARDVRILVDGGYRIESVAPIDQFLFSAHVEVVAVLRRR